MIDRYFYNVYFFIKQIQNRTMRYKRRSLCNRDDGTGGKEKGRQ